MDRGVSVVVDTSRKSSAALARLFKEVCCEDIWRYLYPSSSGFTWSRADDSFSSRIDLTGCPFTWVPSVSACDTVPCPFSDHCSLVFSVSIPNVIPPPVQVHGSKMCPPWMRRSILTLFLISGLDGSTVKPFTPL